MNLKEELEELYKRNFTKFGLFADRKEQVIAETIELFERMAEPIEPHKYSSRIKVLERRRDWLKSQSESTPDRTDISHTRAELSALDWAIKNLEQMKSNLKELTK